MGSLTAWSVKPTLTGSLVVLRPFTVADIEAMGTILADPDVLRLTGSVHTSADAHAAEDVLDTRSRAWYASRGEQTDRLDLAVVDRIDGVCVGEVVLNDWRPHDQTINLRILLGASGRGRGLGSEAVRLMVDHAFTSSDVHRIELEVYAFNARAMHVYERVGFVVEGRRRDALVFDGERIDALIMAILRPDWLAATRSL